MTPTKCHLSPTQYPCCCPVEEPIPYLSLTVTQRTQLEVELQVFAHDVQPLFPLLLEHSRGDKNQANLEVVVDGKAAQITNQVLFVFGNDEGPRLLRRT